MANELETVRRLIDLASNSVLILLNKSRLFLTNPDRFEMLYLRNRSRERCHFWSTVLHCLFFQKNDLQLVR
jgi:hypothetical protein